MGERLAGLRALNAEMAADDPSAALPDEHIELMDAVCTVLETASEFTVVAFLGAVMGIMFSRQIAMPKAAAKIAQEMTG